MKGLGSWTCIAQVKVNFQAARFFISPKKTYVMGTHWKHRIVRYSH